MQLVEKHIINRNHYLYKELDNLCFLSKNLFNYANYLIRQKFIFSGEYLDYYKIQKLCQGTPDYQAIPAKVAQQVLLKFHESWQSFFAATSAYKENPENFLGIPRLPKYKQKSCGRNLLTYTDQAVSKTWLKRGVVHLSKTNILFTTMAKNVCQVRIVPASDHYVIDVVYKKDENILKTEFEGIAGIDIGLNNLATITANQPGFNPLIINGKPFKSINAYYNKKKAGLQSKLTGEGKTSRKIEKLSYQRNYRVDNYLHNASRYLINYLAANSIGTLVIGKNNHWKQNINLGKRSNQNFICIPHARFIKMLAYKAKLAGIKVIITEESYTSKVSFLDNEPICKHSEYLGKRIKRGLFRAMDGRLINADVNGSANIIRKVFPNAFADGILGVVVRPVRITPYKTVA